MLSSIISSVAAGAAQMGGTILQNHFARRNAAEAHDWSVEDAATNRSWQEKMSNTAHQREVADLKAAGLNPILSATGGAGAPVGSGATADADAAETPDDPRFASSAIDAALARSSINLQKAQEEQASTAAETNQELKKLYGAQTRKTSNEADSISPKSFLMEKLREALESGARGAGKVKQFYNDPGKYDKKWKNDVQMKGRP